MKLFLLLISLYVTAQIDTVIQICELPETLHSNSGLVYINDHLFTFNDSGNTAEIYEIDTLIGTVIRTIEMSNASNIDWEDIDADDDYLFIGDFGNNNGTRQDLSIYKVPVNDVLENDQVVSEKISFVFEDQSSFESMPNSTNFDAEALIAMNDNLYIFSKNWGDLQTKVYQLNQNDLTQTATLINAYNAEGMITGATINTAQDQILLCGYNEVLIPFIVTLENFSESNFFEGLVTKYEIAPFIGIGTQVEGICSATLNKYYLSQESFVTSIGGFTIETPAALYTFNFAGSEVSTGIVDMESKQDFCFYANQNIQFHNAELFHEIEQLYIFDINGKSQGRYSEIIASKIEVKYLAQGNYTVTIELINGQELTQQIHVP